MVRATSLQLLERCCVVRFVCRVRLLDDPNIIVRSEPGPRTIDYCASETGCWGGTLRRFSASAIDTLLQVLVIVTFQNFLSLFSHGENCCAG